LLLHRCHHNAKAVVAVEQHDSPDRPMVVGETKKVMLQKVALAAM
jgi:hypothetical protein